MALLCHDPVTYTSEFMQMPLTFISWPRSRQGPWEYHNMEMNTKELNLFTLPVSAVPKCVLSPGYPWRSRKLCRFGIDAIKAILCVNSWSSLEGDIAFYAFSFIFGPCEILIGRILDACFVYFICFNFLFRFFFLLLLLLLFSGVCSSFFILSFFSSVLLLRFSYIFFYTLLRFHEWAWRRYMAQLPISRVLLFFRSPRHFFLLLSLLVMTFDIRSTYRRTKRSSLQIQHREISCLLHILWLSFHGSGRARTPSKDSNTARYKASKRPSLLRSL